MSLYKLRWQSNICIYCSSLVKQSINQSINHLVGYRQLPEPVLPRAELRQLTCLVWACHKTPFNQSVPFVATCGVRQGSVLGPILYTPYVMPVGRLMSCFDVGFNPYADDTQLHSKTVQSAQHHHYPRQTGSSDFRNVPSVFNAGSVQMVWFWSLLNPDTTSSLVPGRASNGLIDTPSPSLSQMPLSKSKTN